MNPPHVPLRSGAPNPSLNLVVTLAFAFTVTFASTVTLFSTVTFAHRHPSIVGARRRARGIAPARTIASCLRHHMLIILKFA